MFLSGKLLLFFIGQKNVTFRVVSSAPNEMKIRIGKL